MNSFLVKFVANSVYKVIGIRRIANFTALSIGPKILDHAVHTVTNGYIPVGAVRFLRTTLSYAPIALVMGTGTGGTAIASALTYYVLVQISETLFMLLVREAASRTFRGVKYIYRSSVNTIFGGEKKDLDNLDDWVILDELSTNDNNKNNSNNNEQQPTELQEVISPEQIKKVEEFANQIDFNEIEQQEKEKFNNSNIDIEKNNNSGGIKCRNIKTSTEFEEILNQQINDNKDIEEFVLI